MTQSPHTGRSRRAAQQPQRPEDMTPVRQTGAPKAKAPIGRSAELKARQRRMQQEAAAQEQALSRQAKQYADRNRTDPLAWMAEPPRQTASPRTYASSGQTDRARQAVQARQTAPTRQGGAANRSTRTYSDFDPPVVSGRKPVRRKQRSGHTFMWLMVSLICLLTSGALLLFAAPQLMGVELESMPSIAFVNGSLISKDQSVIDGFNDYRRMLNNERIYNGVYIDGIHVGGMTREQATAAVATVPGGAGSTFDIGVSVGEYLWSINSDSVPLYRNIDEVVRKAYAIGRGNTTSIRNTTTTPFRQRLGAVQDTLAQPVALYTTTTYDHHVVRSMVDSIAQAINCDPVNASVAAFNEATKKFTFNSDEPGVYIDADAIYAEVTGWLDRGVYTGTVVVEPQTVLAQVTKAELMNSFGLISTFTTKKTGNTNRTTNIALSADAINGTTVLPGETFSFNRATGERTAEKGYKPAAAIAGGETFDEIGGGVCQTSSTLFNAVVRADLNIVSRKPHAWPSDYVPKGEDATVNWPNLDFKFSNDTQWPIFIVSWCDKSAKTVTVEIYGMNLANGVTIDLKSEVTYTKEPPAEAKYVYNPDLPYGTEKQTIKPRTGYKVDTYKIYYQNGKETRREKLHTSNYSMYQKTIEHNKPNVYGTQ